MYDKTYVTLNISSTGVRLLYVTGRQIMKWGSMPLPTGLVKDGLILRPKVMGAVISALFKSTGAPKKRVITSLTGLSFIHRILSLPRMERSDQSEAIQRAVSKEMLLPLEELYLCWQAIGKRADETDFFVLGVPRNHIDTLVQTLGEAGIQPYLADLNPLALARVANRKETIIVALEQDCFDIALVADGMPAIMHTINPRWEGATLEDNIRRLVDELSKTVEFYNINHPQNPLSNNAPVLVTGELSANATASELILAGVGHPVEPLTPPLKLPHDLPVALFTANVGLALKKLPLKSATSGEAALFRDINLNILSGKFRTGTRRLKLPHVLLSLVVLIGLGLLLPVNQFRSQADIETTRLQNELTGVNQELNQALSLVDKAKLIGDTIDKIMADAATAKQEQQNILNKGGNVAYNLGLVTGALPTGTYFTSVGIGAGQITVKGEAENSFKVVGYVEALEKLGKFSEVRIVSIEESKSTGGSTPEAASARVSFNIVISK